MQREDIKYTGEGCKSSGHDTTRRTIEKVEHRETCSLNMVCTSRSRDREHSQRAKDINRGNRSSKGGFESRVAVVHDERPYEGDHMSSRPMVSGVRGDGGGQNCVPVARHVSASNRN